MNVSFKFLLLSAATLLTAAVTLTHAAVVYSDDFATNPFEYGGDGVNSRWTSTEAAGSCPLVWTGDRTPNPTWAATLPTNANDNSVYSGACTSQSMSTRDTSVPARSLNWNTMTYSVDFQVGSVVGGSVIGVLVNRSGNDGYTAAIYTGSDGNILWFGDYGDTVWAGYNVAAGTWYRFKTTVTKSGADISMQSQILNLSGTVLATSPVKTFTNAAYTEPNGFKLSFASEGYWDRARQIDNFSVTATVPEAIANDSFATDPFVSRWTRTEAAGSYPLVWTGNTTPNPTWAATLPTNANDNSVYSGACTSQSMSTVDTSVPAEFSGWTAMDYSVDFRMDGVGAQGAPDGNSIVVLVNRSGDNGYAVGIFTGGDGNVGWMYNNTVQYSDYSLVAGTSYRLTTTVVKSGTTLAIRSKVLDSNDNVLVTSPWNYEYGATYLNPNGFKISFGSGDYWTRATQIDQFSATLSNETFPGGYNAWAVTNAGGQAANLDWDNDGVANGVEFFMNAAPGFTANPVLDSTNKVTWPNGGNIPNSSYGTQFVVQTSTDLVNWTNVPVNDPNLTNTPSLVSYTLTTGPSRQFVRLGVMPN